MTERLKLDQHARLSVAPMMDWTDRHCRFFHRCLSARALLYTEMVTAPALVRGGALRLLEHDPREHPVAVQLGGSDPKELAQATQFATDAGYAEINLNVGCPSDRVQSGAFGAVLMKDPGLVADCVAEMAAATHLPVTVKCRIGVDAQEPQETLPAFLTAMSEAGVERITVHARKAWLDGLSPKENRDIPPLDYPLVHAMKCAFPQMHMSINGGITSLEAAQAHLQHMDGVMIGRAAYHDPAGILLAADQTIFGLEATAKTRRQVLTEMEPYIADHLANGGRLHQIARHMLGLFAGQPGARIWRRVLSTQGTRTDAGLDVIAMALEAMRPAQDLAS